MKQINTKKLILKTALDFISKNGYAGVSIRQIAREVGIRESAIYNHYKSKEEIFAAIMSDFKSRSVNREILSDDLLDDLSNPQKFLKNFSKRLIQYWNGPDERKFIRLLLIEQFTKIGSRDLSVSDYLTELRSICKMIFTEMEKAGIIKEIDPAILAEEFITPLFVMRVEKMSGDGGQDIKSIYDYSAKHVDFFWKAVANS